MILELLLWVLPKVTELAIKVTDQNLNLSNFILLLYLITHRKTHLMGVSFFMCEITGYSSGFGLYIYEWHIYTGYLLIISYFVVLELNRSRNKSVAFCCLALLCLFIFAGVDAYVNPTVETLFYSAYPSILLCIHVCLILSFYNPRRIIDGLVYKFHRLISLLCHNYNMQYICYTFWHKH